MIKNNHANSEQHAWNLDFGTSHITHLFSSIFPCSLNVGAAGYLLPIIIAIYSSYFAYLLRTFPEIQHKQSQ